MTNTSTATKGAHTFHFGVRGAPRRRSEQEPPGLQRSVQLPGRQRRRSMAKPIVTIPTEIRMSRSPLQQYIRNLQLQQAVFSEAQIQAMGGGPSKFSIQGGLPYVSMVRWDAAPFVQDDWKRAPQPHREPGTAVRGADPGARSPRLGAARRGGVRSRFRQERAAENRVSRRSGHLLRPHQPSVPTKTPSSTTA